MRTLKRVLFGLICILGSVGAHATSGSTTISITSFNVKPVMPADILAWAALPDNISLTAQTGAATVGIRSLLVVQVKQGGVLICGNTSATGLPIDPFRTRSFSASDLGTALNGCPRLSPGSYTLCVQFFNEDGGSLSEVTCRNFAVENATPSPPAYSPPQNLTPVNNKVFTQQEVRLPISFSWTPVSPSPDFAVKYKLQIWQIMEGQTVEQAMQSSQPVVTKMVEGATQVSIPEFLTTPCTPPFLCKFAWTVQALSSRESLPVGSNNGTSAPTAAAAPAAQYIIRIDSMKIACTATAGIYSFSYYITNANPGTAKLTNFVVTSSVPAGATILSFSPPLLTTIVSGTQLVITGLITGSPSLTNICVGAEITDVVNTFNKASRDTCIKVPPCRCTACDDNKLTIVTAPTTGIVINGNNTLTLNQPMTITTVPPKLIKSIVAELMYFEYLPESEDCLPCNKDSKTYGNLASGTLAGVTGLNPGTHSMIWNFIPPVSFANGATASMVITLPVSVKCCSANIRWCIRYVITFNDCTVCNKLVCYEKKKDGCGTTTPNPNNN